MTSSLISGTFNLELLKAVTIRRQNRQGTTKPTLAGALMFLAFGVFCFVFPFATFLMSFDLMPFGMEWMSSLLLAMLGFSAGTWLYANYGWAGGLLGSAIFALGLALEYVGVSTGFPFGSYRYTGVLVPELPGGVPVAIGFAWVMVIVCGLFTARLLLPTSVSPRTRTGILLQSALGALLALGLDLLLEPVAYHVKHYWEWSEAGNGGYYGVPWSNFAAWLIAAFVLNLFLCLLLNKNKQLQWGWLPPTLLAMNIFMFGIVNVAHTFWWAGAIAAMLLAGIWAGTRHQSQE